MKITFVTTHLVLEGGVSRVVEDYANKLSEKNHEICIVVQKIDRKKYKFNDKIKIIEIGGYLPSNFLYWLFFNLIKKKYLKVLNEIDTDIYFSQLFPTNFFCSKIRKEGSFKHIYFCHEPFRYYHDENFISYLPILKRVMNLFFKLIFKRLDIIGARRSDLIICNSKFTKNKVINAYNKNSYVFYPILNLNNKDKGNIINLRKKFNLKASTPIIFSLGLTHHMKGAYELMEIYKKILHKNLNVVLIIGGRISSYNSSIIKNLIKKFKIPKNKIFFSGLIDSCELPSFYHQSTLTLYTAKNEPFGLIPFESIKYGTPVIAFEGGPSETILNEKTGFIIKNYNINEFAEKAIKIIENNDLFDKFSKNGKIYIEKKFNFNKAISKLESLFRYIINK